VSVEGLEAASVVFCPSLIARPHGVGYHVSWGPFYEGHFRREEKVLQPHSHKSLHIGTTMLSHISRGLHHNMM
jgi:hypothetical protein